MTVMDRNEFLRPLAELADQGRWDDVYVWFREHQEAFSRRERRLIREALAAQLSVSRLWRAPALLAAATLLFQLVSGGIFENQLQDLFSFLGRSFRPYMYIASVAPLLVNLALDALLAVQCYERLVLTYRLFGRRPPWARACGAWALALALALWSACSLVPYARDLPLVLEGKWSTGIVTLEMEEDTAWNNAMAQLGRETREGYDPIPWYSNPRWSTRSFDLPYELKKAEFNQVLELYEASVGKDEYPNHGYRTDDGHIVRRAYCYGIIHSR